MSKNVTIFNIFVTRKSKIYYYAVSSPMNSFFFLKKKNFRVRGESNVYKQHLYYLEKLYVIHNCKL